MVDTLLVGVAIFGLFLAVGYLRKEKILIGFSGIMAVILGIVLAGEGSGLIGAVSLMGGLYLIYQFLAG